MKKGVKIEVKEGFITMEVVGDILISYPVFGDKTKIDRSVNRFAEDLKRALNGERISTLK